MTSFLGPDNPPPFSVISETSQRLMQVSKVQNVEDSLFNCGEEYYSQLSKLIRLQTGINIDDRVCVICSRKSRVADELARRLCLIYPIVRLSFGRALYEEVSGERDINVGVLNIDAEDYFAAVDVDHNKFDKVIIFDGLELVEERDKFFEKVKLTLQNNVDSSLVIVHRTKDMLTLPVYIEAVNDFQKTQIEVDELLLELIRSGFLVGWNIVSLPISIAKDKWFNQLFNHFPSVMENINPTDVYGGLRQLADTSFKYSEYVVSLKDRFLFLVANPSENIRHNQPYKMYLVDDEIESTADISRIDTATKLLRLNITPDIRCFLPKNIGTMRLYTEEDEEEYPEEWWGTTANVPIVGLDRTRINKYIRR